MTNHPSNSKMKNTPSHTVSSVTQATRGDHNKYIHLTDKDLNLNFHIAKNYSLNWFKRHVVNNTDCYLNGQLVFSFRKGCFRNQKYFDLLETNLVPRLLNSDHRKMAGGNLGKRVTIMSGILGYYDKLTPQMKLALGGVHQAGRETAFVKHYPEKWNSLVPFFQEINQAFKTTCPVEYSRQHKASRKVHKKLCIPKTVFTTITVNKNWRTSTHTDKGDFKDGMSCLVIIGNNYQGGYLGFPRLGIVVHVQHGDILFMNSHEPHCNTELTLGKNGTRYSIVCYLRPALQQFQHEKTIGNNTFFLS